MSDLPKLHHHKQSSRVAKRSVTHQIRALTPNSPFHLTAARLRFGMNASAGDGCPGDGCQTCVTVEIVTPDEAVQRTLTAFAPLSMAALGKLQSHQKEERSYGATINGCLKAP